MDALTNSAQTFDEVKKVRCENRWTAAEDKILFAQVLKANGRSICWRSVAAALPGRNNKSCRKRWIHSLDPGLRKGRWTPAEDLCLAEAVNVHGKHWFQVARMLSNGRTDDQCAKRWREALDPKIKRGPWAEHEDNKLIALFRTHGRKWNDIAAALDGRPPVQCRNRWLSLVRAGRIEDDPIVRRGFREDPHFHLPAPGNEIARQVMFGNTTEGNPSPGHFPFRRSSWGDHQASLPHDEGVGQPMLYPPTYPEGQYHGHRFPLSNRVTDLIGPGYCPPSHTTGYLPPSRAQAEAQAVPQPVHLVAPTPVNLIIQTNFTHVEHNYHYGTQEYDSSGYATTPPPTTASSTRSSFSFSSTDLPATPPERSQEHATYHDSQSRCAVHNVDLPHNQYDVVDDRYYDASPLSEHKHSPCHGSLDGETHPHGAYYPSPSDYGSPGRNSGCDSEPESDRGWVVHPVPSYGFYATQNQGVEAWEHPSWFHPVVTKSGGVGSDGAIDCTTDCSGSAERPTDY